MPADDAVKAGGYNSLATIAPCRDELEATDIFRIPVTFAPGSEIVADDVNNPASVSVGVAIITTEDITFDEYVSDELVSETASMPSSAADGTYSINYKAEYLDEVEDLIRSMKLYGGGNLTRIEKGCFIR